MTTLATDKLVEEHFEVDEEDFEGQAIPNFSGTGGLVKPAENLIDPTVNKEDEIISERTERTKTYKLEDDKRRTIAASPKAHYKNYPSNELEHYKEVDLTLQEKSDRYTLPQRNGQSTAPFELAIYKHQIGYIIEDKQGGTVAVQLDKIGNTNVDSEFIEQNVIISVGGNTVYWSIPSMDLGIRVSALPEKVETWKTIQNANSPRKFQWIVDETKNQGRYKFQKNRIDGHDDNGDRVEVHDDTRILEEANEHIRYEHTEEFTGRASKINDPETRSYSWKSAEYPVEIDPSTSKDITANIDDVTDTVNGSLDSNKVFLKYYSLYSDTATGGLRFRSLGISQGASIDKASISIYVFSQQNTPVAKIYADDVDDAPQWSSNDLPGDINKSSNFYDWTITASGSQPFYITNIVQEVISRSGWSSNNDIRFAMFPDKGAGTDFQAEFSDYYVGDIDAAGTLSVTWNPPQLLSNKFPGFGVLNWSITASNITASHKDGILADVSSSALTITLPPSPETGDVVAVKDYRENASTNNITVDRNGNNINGSASNLTISTDGGGVRLVYSDDTGGWSTISQV